MIQLINIIIHTIERLKHTKAHILNLGKKFIMKILNLKLLILLQYQNIKTFWQNAMFSNWSKENFVNKNIKNTVPWTYAKTDLKGAEIV